MGAGGPASGVFGSAKNAMLQKEREKEAGRPLDMSVAAKAFPTLVPGLDNDRDDASANKPRQLTVLLAGDNKGEVHIYLDGSVFLGSVQVKDGSSVIGTVIRPDATCTMIAVVGSTPPRPSARQALSQLHPTFSPAHTRSHRGTIHHAAPVARARVRGTAGGEDALGRVAQDRQELARTPRRPQ